MVHRFTHANGARAPTACDVCKRAIHADLVASVVAQLTADFKCAHSLTHSATAALAVATPSQTKPVN